MNSFAEKVKNFKKTERRLLHENESKIKKDNDVVYD